MGSVEEILANKQEMICLHCGTRSWGPLANQLPACVRCGTGELTRTGRYMLPRYATHKPRIHETVSQAEPYKLTIEI